MKDNKKLKTMVITIREILQWIKIIKQKILLTQNVEWETIFFLNYLHYLYKINSKEENEKRWISHL